MDVLEGLEKLLAKEEWETRTLEEVSSEIYGGNGVTREQLGTGTHPAVKCSDVNGKLSREFSECVSHVDPALIENPKYFEHGDILISTYGDEDTVGSVVLYVGHERCLAGNDVVVVKSSQNTRYLAHMLTSRRYNRQLSQAIVESRGHHLHMKSVRMIKLPMPALHIQEKIADYMDLWMELRYDLERRLEEQKELYRNFQDLLTSFGR